MSSMSEIEKQQIIFIGKYYAIAYDREKSDYVGYVQTVQGNWNEIARKTILSDVFKKVISCAEQAVTDNLETIHELRIEIDSFKRSD